MGWTGVGWKGVCVVWKGLGLKIKGWKGVG